MAQLKEDEWPADREPTTTEHEAEVDPLNGPKDPERPINRGPDIPSPERPATHERRG
jgi:hypothetical protein